MRGRTSRSAGRFAIVAAVVVLATGLAGSASAQREQDKDCSLGSSGATPLIDLGTDTYNGAQGGLYPLGSNEVPPAHLATGLTRAAEIVPRNAEGEPDPDGVIVFASIGFSNPFREFVEFERLAEQRPEIADSVVFVNAAQGGQHVELWASPGDRPWEGLATALDQAGVTHAQVQAVWVKHTQRVGQTGYEGFPANTLRYRDDLVTIARLLASELPNLQIAYLSSRVYGGYNQVSSPSPEPVAYEEGFGVKWTIEAQIAGESTLNADPEAGEVVAPWLAWGPYLWADGTTPRSDGLTWPCNEVRGDGAHLNSAGNQKVGRLLLEFLESEPTAAWMFTDRELPEPPSDVGEPIPTSTIPGDAGVTGDTIPPGDAADGEARGQRGGAGAQRGTRTDPGDEGADDEAPDEASEEAAPLTTTTTAPEALAAEPDDGEIPPWVWALVGAGGALVIAAAVTALSIRRRSAKRAD